MNARLGSSRPTFYFDRPGRHNLSKTVQLVSRRAAKGDTGRVVVFTRDGEGVFRLAKILEPQRLVGVTFPYKQLFSHSDDLRGDPVMPPTSLPDVVSRFRTLDIALVRGTMPFQPPVIPYVIDAKVEGIRNALNIISRGLNLCVQAVLMACDAGAIEPGETVISMSADTAIVARGAPSLLMFHPTTGMQIREIICKPTEYTDHEAATAVVERRTIGKVGSQGETDGV